VLITLLLVVDSLDTLLLLTPLLSPLLLTLLQLLLWPTLLFPSPTVFTA